MKNIIIAANGYFPKAEALTGNTVVIFSEKEQTLPVELLPALAGKKISVETISFENKAMVGFRLGQVMTDGDILLTDDKDFSVLTKASVSGKTSLKKTKKTAKKTAEKAVKADKTEKPIIHRHRRTKAEIEAARAAEAAKKEGSPVSAPAKEEKKEDTPAVPTETPEKAEPVSTTDAASTEENDAFDVFGEGPGTAKASDLSGPTRDDMIKNFSLDYRKAGFPSNGYEDALDLYLNSEDREDVKRRAEGKFPGMNPAVKESVVRYIAGLRTAVTKEMLSETA